ncbi:hypothetical protein [Brevibacillus brevis]|nr:hypothetical protein C7J99_31740 [Brevibacillus brevis]RED19780.1 hypothetical protein DES34_1404 [Brevibacillus brevis]VEF87239.1 Uncharacterised protein [Brevibacillus brevis]VEF87601.1 Uncharacterised protein [Brevibacillus brevis]VEF90167.1 Uncharacterised protein [Brevibacillus brevis]
MSETVLIQDERFTCIGKPAYGLFKKWRDLPGCGLKWEHDTPDGKCPVCRGNLIPTSMVGPQHRISGGNVEVMKR